MGEKGPTKQEKEQIRKKNQQARDEYDFSHLGNYKLVYPVMNNPVRLLVLDKVQEKAAKFDMYLE